MKIVNRINRLFIKKFDHCWVPDFKNSFLSGELSQSSLKKTFIGPLSRFKKTVGETNNYKYKFLAIISGPEPQRSLLEEEIQNCFLKTNQYCAIINGLINKKETSFENISFYPHLETTAFKKLLTKSELVICRSGYSSIMDLYVLQKKVLNKPPPSQTEQKYLGKHQQKNHSIDYQKQDRINLEKARFNFIHPKNEKKKKLLKVAFDKLGL